MSKYLNFSISELEFSVNPKWIRRIWFLHWLPSQTGSSQEIVVAVTPRTAQTPMYGLRLVVTTLGNTLPPHSLPRAVVHSETQSALTFTVGPFLYSGEYVVTLVLERKADPSNWREIGQHIAASIQVETNTKVITRVFTFLIGTGFVVELLRLIFNWLL